MDMFSALAEPNRRSILEMLASDGQLSATAIARKFQVSPPAISQHLKILREARLVRMEKHAQQRLYQIDPEAMHELEGWARRMAEQYDRRFDRLEQVAKQQEKRSARQATGTPAKIKARKSTGKS